MSSQHAIDLLRNPAYKESFSTVRERLVQQLESGRLRDDERENAVTALWLLKNLQKHIEALVNEDKVKEFNLRQKKRLLG